MSISALGSAGANFTPLIQPKAEPAAVRKEGSDAGHDGDGDDGRVSGVKAPALPVNFSGQTLGGTINVTA